MSNLLDDLRKSTFQWFAGCELGYFPVKNTPYDTNYFDHYVACALTEIGKNLNAARIALVRSVVGDGAVLDVGAGALTFLKAHGNCWGFDVNPISVEALDKECRLFDPYNEDLSRFQAITFFDSFEHLSEPWDLLNRIGMQFIIMSLPIFRDYEHAYNSKHYKPYEHYWYFTAYSLRRFMQRHGFKLVSQNDDETRLGREDIQTFVFRRKNHE